MKTSRVRRFRPVLDVLGQRIAPTGIVFAPMPATDLDTTLILQTPMPDAPSPIQSDLLATTLPDHCV